MDIRGIASGTKKITGTTEMRDNYYAISNNQVYIYSKYKYYNKLCRSVNVHKFIAKLFKQVGLE